MSLKLDGLRASKRVGLAKGLGQLLDTIGIDDATKSVNGFQIKTKRNIYDEETSSYSVDSPPGMYLAVVDGTRMKVFSSESDSDVGAPMGNSSDQNGYELYFQYAPARFLMTGLQAEGVDTLMAYERQPGSPYGSQPYVFSFGTASSPIAPMVGVPR